jgi:hypothetical protein
MATINLSGSTSGVISIVAPAVAGSNTLNLPTKSGDIAIFTDATGAMYLPIGTTAQRPSSPATGMIRMNTTIGNVEYYNGTSWVNFNA